jgi:hypothetical protein
MRRALHHVVLYWLESIVCLVLHERWARIAVVALQSDNNCDGRWCQLLLVVRYWLYIGGHMEGATDFHIFKNGYNTIM